MSTRTSGSAHPNMTEQVGITLSQECPGGLLATLLVNNNCAKGNGCLFVLILTADLSAGSPTLTEIAFTHDCGSSKPLMPPNATMHGLCLCAALCLTCILIDGQAG